MHGAPGGQTGQNIDDSPNNLPELFMDAKYEERLTRLWLKLVDRYKDNPVIAAYDLLNEPLPKRTGAAEKYKHMLEPMYERLTEAIREIDKKHMIIVEGADWSNDWSVFSEPFDDNLVYQFHYYCWNNPDNLNNIDYFLDLRKNSTPLFGWVRQAKGIRKFIGVLFRILRTKILDGHSGHGRNLIIHVVSIQLLLLMVGIR